LQEEVLPTRRFGL